MLFQLKKNFAFRRPMKYFVSALPELGRLGDSKQTVF